MPAKLASIILALFLTLTAMAPATAAAGQTTRICPGPNATAEILRGIFAARAGDTIELCAGRFDLDAEIPVQDKRGITIAGAGIDETIVSFAGSRDAMGFTAVRTQGFTLRDMTIEDAQVVGAMVLFSEQVTLERIRVRWSGWESCAPVPGAPGSCTEHGEVGISVEWGHDVLVSDVEVTGATLGGFVVIGLTDAVFERVRAERNVVGFNLWNSRRVLLTDGVFVGNSAGLLVSDFAQHDFYGARVSIRDSRIAANDTPNFTRPGHGLGAVPSGVGVLLIAMDQVELLGNEITDNGTAGLVLLNAGLLNPAEANTKFDFFPEGLHVRDNVLRDNGGAPGLLQPQPPTPAAVLIPLILARNGGRGAQIAWDGAVDEPNDCTARPTDERGVPLDQSNPGSPRREARTDERGRPSFEDADPHPSCRWNAWKFDEAGTLRPENRIVITGNQFERTRPETQLVADFANFHVSSPDEQGLRDLFEPGSNDLAPHQGTLEAWSDPEPLLPYVVDPASENDRPTHEETAAACVAPAPGEVNWAALARHDCPRLDQYGLFADPDDPRSNPNGGGFHYTLNTPLFSDYAVKYRFLFVPPGEQAEYADYVGDPSVPWDDQAQRSLALPVGSVIAKTFAFRIDDADGNTTREDVVETRLLVKRAEQDRAVWVGMAYRWTHGSDGRVAEFVPEGARVSVEFDYLDDDPEVVDENGNRRRYTGMTPEYAIPAAATCASCHGGEARDPGAAPISLKPRHLNRETHCDATGGPLNQLDCLVAAAKLVSLPDASENLERIPRWNVPGDSGHAPGSPLDVHERMRGYLEINCSNCHSHDGRARFTHMFLDSFRPVDVDHGICRQPAIAGRFGNRQFDIQPGRADLSILHHRDTIGGLLRMPPLARSLVNEEASALMIDWIDRALTDPTVAVADDGCAELGGSTQPSGQ